MLGFVPGNTASAESPELKKEMRVESSSVSGTPLEVVCHRNRSEDVGERQVELPTAAILRLLRPLR